MEHSSGPQNDTSKPATNYSLIRLVGLSIGIPVLVIAILSAKNALTAEDWPSTSGTVMQAEKTGLRTKRLDLKVAYTVGSQAFVCKRIEFGDSPRWRDSYRYYPTANATVFYNPENPEECVLEPGISGALVFKLLLGLSLSLVALFAHGKLKGTLPVKPGQSSGSSLNPASIEQAHELADAGKTVEAIKVYRQATGLGLKDSKEYIESYNKNRIGRS